MKNAFGLSVPEQLQDVCTPSRCALLIYDMQVGIVPQITEGPAVLAQCQKLLGAARVDLTNDSERDLDTAESSWVLVIDGKPAPDPGGQLWMRPRPSGGYDTLAPRRNFEFGKALALSQYFPKARSYKLYWSAVGFGSNTVVVRGGNAP